MNVILDSIISFVLFVFGLTLISFIGIGLISVLSPNVTQYIKKPYCESAKLGDEVIKKCWKLVEIKE